MNERVRCLRGALFQLPIFNSGLSRITPVMSRVPSLLMLFNALVWWIFIPACANGSGFSCRKLTSRIWPKLPMDSAAPIWPKSASVRARWLFENVSKRRLSKRDAVKRTQMQWWTKVIRCRKSDEIILKKLWSSPADPLAIMISANTKFSPKPYNSLVVSGVNSVFQIKPVVVLKVVANREDGQLVSKKTMMMICTIESNPNFSFCFLSVWSNVLIGQDFRVSSFMVPAFVIF